MDLEWTRRLTSMITETMQSTFSLCSYRLHCPFFIKATLSSFPLPPRLLTDFVYPNQVITNSALHLLLSLTTTNGRIYNI